MIAFSTRLRTRLVLLALLVIVPALVVVAYDQAMERRRAQERAEEDLRGAARVAAMQQGAAFDTAHKLLLALAEAPIVRDSAPGRCPEMLARIVRSRPEYTNVWLYDAGGKRICSGLPVDRSRINTHPWWLEQTRRTRQATVGDFQISLATGKPSVVVTHPVLGPSGDLVRIIAIGLDLGRLPITSTVPLPAGMSAALADRDGTILTWYPGGASRVGLRQPQAILDAWRQGAAGGRTFETIGADGIRRLHVVVPVATALDTGLFVTVGIEPSAAMAEATALFHRHLGLLAMLALLTVGLAVAGGHQFVLRPIAALTTVTTRITAGDFGARAQLVAGAPGLGELAHAINSMAAGLADRERRQAEAERALHDTEERMRFALSAAQVGVWETRFTTGERYWSDTTEALHGLTPGAFGRTREAFLACIHPDDRPSVVASIDTALRNHEASLEREYRTVWPDGTEHHLRSTGRIFCDDAGCPDRATGVVWDITERRTLEERLRQAHKMEAVGQLAGGIAHDFNNILTAILGNAELLLEDLPHSDPRRQFGEEIKAAGSEAAALTQQLLAFSRRQVLMPRVIRLRDVLDGTTPMLLRLLGEAIDLRTTAGDLGRIRADAGQMQQVVVNLAVNARDAMPDGGRLTIATTDVTLDVAHARQHPLAGPGRFVLLTVTDTGHGMAAATKQRIFEPFFTTKPQGRGTGLGLATVHGIVEQSHGYITVDSELGHGTTFNVYFPHACEAEVETPTSTAAVTAARGTETILLVEDEAMVRTFVHRALRRLGYCVHVAADSGQAIEFGRAYRDTLHVILTDVVLTDMNGLAMAAHVRQDHPEARVLYMSGYTDNAIVRDDVLAPGTWFLQKPFTADTLGRKLREVFDGTPPS